MTEQKVTVGDRVVSLESFSGFKALRAGTLVARLTKHVGGMAKEVAEFARTYEAANTETVTPARFEYKQNLEVAAGVQMARERLLAEGASPESEEFTSEVERIRSELEASRMEISDEAWERSGNKIEISRAPSPQEVGAFLFPQLLEKAEDEITRLLALVLAPDAELRKVKREGTEAYLAYLDEKAEELLFVTEVEELLDIAVTVAKSLQERLQGKVESLQGAWTGLLGADSTKSEEPEGEGEPEIEPTPSPSGESSSSTSSTDSGLSTDGPTTSGSGETGAKSSASSTA